MAFERGYKKAPVEFRFEKGVSGNPKGRPPGSKNFKTLLMTELTSKIVIQESDRKKTVTRLEAITKRIVANALQGDVKSVHALFDLLRKTGQLDAAEPEKDLPDDHAAALDEFVKKRAAAAAKNKKPQP